VALVADGLSNREVARELGLSEHKLKNTCSTFSISWGSPAESNSWFTRGEPRWCLASGVGRGWGG
jgi:hypothetical protein